MLKEDGPTHWHSESPGADNRTGFTALPGGYRYSRGAGFSNLGYSGMWWTSTAYNNSNVWNRSMGIDGDNMNKDLDLKNYGFSVRCTKDLE